MSVLSFSHEATRKVPFEVHIESRCPDTRDCLQKLVAPAYWQVEDQVDFRISYGLGKAKKRHSIGDALDFNAFVLSDFERVSDKGLIEECAQEHNVDYEKIGDCANSEEGLELLISSVARSVAVNAKASCTVRVDDKVWCVRHTYEWKCPPGRGVVENLVREIKKLSGDGEDGAG
ncbi:GILT family thiol reductase [Aspergillus bombycis]|uniref:GILT family thiol reductase n=1 Tax=Aspergillus bombycis TaxID=109264 RepID=A0A1F8A7F3_9EURO|nr:GILT family thiol reductase [Aspergillus bombycis]OGM47349.1 GILT family thiol reductase [Aspergillus bombycis]